MADYILHAISRDITGKKVKSLRADGFIPAVLYGHDVKPTNLTLPAKEFSKVFSEAGSSNLVKLEINEKNPVNILILEPQVDPVRDFTIHADLYQVRMDEKIKTEIPIEFVGVSEAVEQLDGTLITNKSELEVECLPGDLVDHIEVDLSVLKTFEDSVHVKDLKVTDKIEILADPEEMIVSVEPPRSEEEMAELEESAADTEAEAIEKMTEEKPEGEEGATEGEESKAEPTEEKKKE